MNGRPIKTKARIAKFLNLSFIYVAGLTPAGHEVEVEDDFFEELDYDEPVDLVGLTAMTSQAPRAYQIAEEYRKRGVKTVMGGFHASFCPEEASEKVDAVVIGEAEPVWGEVVKDASAGQLKKFYRAELLESLSGLPAPRYDLVKNKRQVYTYYPLWAGKGCPLNCKFCSVTAFYGNQYRSRPVKDIIRDASLIPTKLVFIIDDNLGAYGDALYQLLPELMRFKFRWIAQIDYRFALNEKLLDMAKEAGMELGYIGFETIFPDRLQNIGKGWAKRELYEKAIRNLHRWGIAVAASVMFGIGPENPDTVRETLDFFIDQKVDVLALYFYTPAPGTQLFKELTEQGINFSKDWVRYDGTFPVLFYEGSSWEEMEDLYWSFYQGFYRVGSIMKRFFRIPYGPKFWLIYLGKNLLIFRVDVNHRRSMFYNGVSYLDILSGFSPIS